MKWASHLDIKKAVKNVQLNKQLLQSKIKPQGENRSNEEFERKRKTSPRITNIVNISKKMNILELQNHPTLVFMV